MNEKEFQELLKKTKARGAKATEAAQNPDAAKDPVSLPAWADSVRGIPNALLRSALFGVSKKRKMYTKRTLIAAIDGYEIRQKGETFNQTDLDNFGGLLHLVMPYPLGTVVEFTAHSFLKSIGRGVGGKDHEQLKEELMRLITTGIEISNLKTKEVYVGTLVDKYRRNDETGYYSIVLNSDLIGLFKQNCYTLIDWEQRMKLGNNHLAKWLLDIYSTHAKPYPYKVSTILELCGSDTKELYKFRQTLKKALDELKAIGVIESWEIDESDLVHVTRTPSDSQRRHLVKQRKPAKPRGGGDTSIQAHLGITKR